MASPISVPSLTDFAKSSVPQTPSVWQTNPVLSYVSDIYSSIAARREAMGLKNPGTMENLNAEVSRDVFLTNYFFTGLRADLSKSFSMNPAFQVSHSFSLGSPLMPAYRFGAFYATDNIFFQGFFDNDYSLSGRFHYGWSKSNTTKANVQISDQGSMLQLEHDIQAADTSINIKTLNPSISEGPFTGVIVSSVLQSVSSKLALGLEAVYSKQAALYPADAAVSYVGRYVSGDWVAAAQIQAQGAVNASFWRKVTDKVEAGIETVVSIGGNQQAMMLGAPPTIEANTTLGAKYEFRQSIFRGQVDSSGKVAFLLERRVLPVVSILCAGEIDHFKSTAKVGLGLQFEAGGEEAFAQAQQAAAYEQEENFQAHPPM